MVQIADPNIGAAITENWGRQTAYAQRYFQATNRQISTAINDLATVQADLATQQAQLTAQQATLTAQQATLSAAVADLADQEAALAAVVADMANFDIQIAALEKQSNSAFGSAGYATTASVSPDGSGIGSFAHGYDSSGLESPRLSFCTVFPFGYTYFHVQLVSVDNTYLTVALYDAAGNPITSGSYVVVYKVSGWG